MEVSGRCSWREAFCGIQTPDKIAAVAMPNSATHSAKLESRRMTVMHRGLALSD